MLALLLLTACLAVGAHPLQDPTFPLPFYRELRLASPQLQGDDVFILQNLLARDSACCARELSSSVPTTRTYDKATAEAVGAFQQRHNIPATQVVDVDTAARVLELLSADGYKDDGKSAAAQGFMYKVHFQVHRNRSIESNATLYDANNTPLLTFRVRAHGHNANASSPWPDFNSTDPGLNMFSSDGNTPTGLMTFDLNSPEDDPRLYGPYPVNRAVQGLKGNAAFLVPNIRNGILMHTGEWPDWTPPQPMPNSAGCVHAWPAVIERVWHLLVDQGVVVRPNTDGKLPYPYRAQGLLSIEQVD